LPSTRANTNKYDFIHPAQSHITAFNFNMQCESETET